MRVVLDTNILTRASYSVTGPAAELLDHLKQPEHVLVLSSFILDELDRVLRYPRVRKLHGFDDTEIDEFVRDVADAALVVQVASPSTGIVSHDPDDDPVVATAVDGNADVLCTRDRHLHHADVVDYCRQEGIEVLDDVELLNRLRTAGSP
jgi:uncharacterized protein